MKDKGARVRRCSSPRGSLTAAVSFFIPFFFSLGTGWSTFFSRLGALSVDVELKPLAKFHQSLGHFIHHVQRKVGPHHLGVEVFVVIVVLRKREAKIYSFRLHYKILFFRTCSLAT